MGREENTRGILKEYKESATAAKRLLRKCCGPAATNCESSGQFKDWPASELRKGLGSLQASRSYFVPGPRFFLLVHQAFQA